MWQMQSTRFIGSLVHLEIDRPLGSKHPEFGCTYPINYGYLPDELAPDGEPLDAYVLGVTRAIDFFRGRCIAVIHRLNDSDDKLVVVPDGMDFSDESIRQATEFQEQFFESVILRNI